MKFTVRTNKEKQDSCDLLVVFPNTSVDPAVSVVLDQAKKEEHFEDQVGKTLLVQAGNNAKRILLCGVGKTSDVVMYDFLTIASCIGKRARDVSAKTVTIFLPAFPQIDAFTLGKGLVEGLTLGTYIFDRYQSQKNPALPLETMTVVCSPDQKKDVEDGIQEGQVTSQAVVVARDLVNEPSSVTTPTYLADTAKNLAERSEGKISCDVFGKDEVKALGMHAFLGVARGSDEEPKFIRLSYKAPRAKKTICLVGKGITFDAGGLSLKTAEGMETMKMDMAGAAAILGIFSVLEDIDLNVNVVGLIAATENMPSGKAVKPGDILTAMNGKTIEIVNTDAEGRVILADALSWSGIKEKPDIIIDLATLTGACMVALGEEIAGLFTNDDNLGKALLSQGRKTGEKLWELPLEDCYRDLLKSAVADVKNSAGKKYGGAITAALFLKEFVPLHTAWAHIDIAGPAYAEKSLSQTPHGGSGYGVRVLLSYLSSII